MAVLPIVYGPAPIFQQPAQPVSVFNQQLVDKLCNMAETLYYHQAWGIGANMVGFLDQIIVVDLQEDGRKNLYKIVNPIIQSSSQTYSSLPESSLSFPGIRVVVKRPSAIVVSYQDETGKVYELAADGMLARVIQHEMDYLEGKTFLERISPTKKQMCLLKYQKR